LSKKYFHFGLTLAAPYHGGISGTSEDLGDLFGSLPGSLYKIDGAHIGYLQEELRMIIGKVFSGNRPKSTLLRLNGGYHPHASKSTIRQPIMNLIKQQQLSISYSHT
jgi:hypothetical protein